MLENELKCFVILIIVSLTSINRRTIVLMKFFILNIQNLTIRLEKSIMNDLMNELSGKVIRVVDKTYSIFMTDQEIRSSVQTKFKNHVSYKIIKKLNVIF